MTDTPAPRPTTRAPIPTPARAALVVLLIYIFLVGVSSLESGIKLLGADVQETLFSTVTNPLAGLFIGILATVMVQSSSASTSVIVGLVASGAVGVEAAVPMIMGANIGTTVTNTLVALGHMRQSVEFRRALAAATVHDFFNVLAVAVLLPLELATGVLARVAAWISERLVGASGTEWRSPVKELVAHPVAWIQDAGEAIGTTGNVLGVLMVVVGIAVILGSLTFITKNMRRLVADRIERSLNALLGKGGGLMAMALGVVITIAVQSSTITTSIMVPLTAAGVLTLRNAFPITLGANIGTTVTALLAAMAASRPEALTIAVVHTLFNCTAIAFMYPIQVAREVPIRAAEMLADLAAERRSWAFAYVVGMFIVVPLVGIALLR
ncbi:MAG: Na/Pi symporter [Acidimicrobiales bacterium]